MYSDRLGKHIMDQVQDYLAGDFNTEYKLESPESLKKLIHMFILAWVNKLIVKQMRGGTVFPYRCT